MIRIDEYNYDLKQFNEMIQKSEIEFSFWSGRKIVFSNNSKKLSFHYNHILNSLLQINPNQLTSEDIPTLNVLTRRFRKLENKGHEANSFRQKFYNVFRRFIPNFFRENKIRQLENFTLLHTRLFFDKYTDCLLDPKEKNPIYRGLIPMLDACNTEEERANLLTIFLQRLEVKTSQLRNNSQNFLKAQSFVNEINESFSISFAQCKKNNFQLFNSMNCKLQPLDNLMGKTFEDLELERIERYFSDVSLENINNILNSIKRMLPQKKDRLSFLKDAKNLMNGASNKFIITLIFKKILEFLPKDRKDRCLLIQTLKTFTNNISSSYEKELILWHFSEILTKNKENCFFVMRKARTFVNEISNDRVEFDVKIAILELMQTFLNELSLEEGLSLIQHAKNLMNDISSGQDKAIILHAVSRLPNELNTSDKLSLIQHAKNLMNDISSGQDRAIILQAVSKLPKKLNTSERLSLILDAKTLMVGITNGQGKAAILHAVSSLPRELNARDRLSLIQHAKTLMVGITNGYDRATILQIVAEMPNELNTDDRFFIIQHAKTLMNDVLSDRAIILQTVARLPNELNTSDKLLIIQHAKTLMIGITNGLERAIILDAVAKSVKLTDTTNFLIGLVQQRIKNKMTEGPLNARERIEILNSTIASNMQKE